ncbi:histidine phosphatase family protein [Candidatus Parcubacteria bacterium]|nr:histidine phosphatase family protein [Candidatus Parcubacteria bacterium]
MAKIYIIRHGETDFNVQNRYLGRTDISLNLKGKNQAKKMFNRINSLDIDIVISSPLKRALETAKIIKQNGKKVLIDNHFIERSVGVYEGLTKKEAKLKYPDLYAKNITRIYNDAPLGGETIKNTEKRVFKGLNNIKKIYKDKNILLITHAFVAKIINKYFNPNISESKFYAFTLKNLEFKDYQFN